MTERWRRIRAFDVPFPYDVSNYGRVRNRRTYHMLAPKKNNRGYLRVTLCGFQFLIHRLVAQASKPGTTGRFGGTGAERRPEKCIKSHHLPVRYWHTHRGANTYDQSTDPGR